MQKGRVGTIREMPNYQHTIINLCSIKSFPIVPDTVCGDFEQDETSDNEQIACLSEHYGDVFCSVCLNRNNCIKLEAA